MGIRRILSGLHPLGHPYWRVVITHNPGLRLLFTGMHDFLLHELYWLLAVVRHRMRGSPVALPGASDEAYASLRDRGFAIIAGGERLRAALPALAPFWIKFDRFQAAHRPGHRPPLPVRYRGMLSVPAISDNQAAWRARWSAAHWASCGRGCWRD